jgi:hypothetical protein
MGIWGDWPRDLHVGLGALEEFAYGRGNLPAAILQPLARDLFQHAEYDPTMNLMRPANRAAAKPLGVLPAPYEPKPLTFKTGAPRGMAGRLFVNVPIAELVLEQIDARSGLDRLEACLPLLERAFADWQQGGAAANFELLVAAASPRAAVIFHSSGWPEADGCCEPEIAPHAVLRAIERGTLPDATGIIVAGLGLLLGRSGRARQRRDAAEICRAGSVPLVVALMAPHNDDVEAMISTVAVEPRVLH